jgi:hypothetical protein
LIVGIYVAASTIFMIVECWRPIPIGDSWALLVSGREITWAWLVSQHYEHRMALPRLFLILDYWLSAETNVVDFVAGIAMQAGLAFLVVRLFRGAAGRVETVWATGLTLALLFWSVQWDAFTWGLPFVEFSGELLVVAGTLSLLALGPPTLAILAVVVALGFVAAYDMASGILVSFLAVALAIWLDRPRSHVAILSIGAVSVVICYLVGYHTPTLQPNPLNTLAHPTAIAAYAAAYFGGPIGISIGWIFGIDPVAAAIAAGGIGILTFLVLGWRLIRRRASVSPYDAVLFALASFVAAGGLLTAFGRAALGIGQALSSRYATQVVLF